MSTPRIKESRRRQLVAENRALEAPPPKLWGVPGEFRQDARRQAHILFEMRAYLEGVRRERARPGLTTLD